MVAQKKIISHRDRQLLELRDLYVALYFQGITIKQLQSRVTRDFADRGMPCVPLGFVEKAIYSRLMPGKKLGG